MKRCAEGGHSAAQYQLGGAYKQGLGVAKNRIRALGWLLRATAQHDHDAGIQAVLMSDEMRPDEFERAARWAYDLGEDER